MGYDVHITKAEYWFENHGQEISSKEWLKVVRSDEELVPMPENGDYFAVWRGTVKYLETWFDWTDGNIVTKNPDQPTLKKMLEIADQFDAQVQGDEGEIFDEDLVNEFDDSYLDGH